MRRGKIPFGDKVAQFMYGRNGMDSLNKFMFWAYIALIALNLVVNSFILNYLGLMMMVVYLFRVMSKNLWKRQKENKVYLNIRNKVTGRVRLLKNRWVDRKIKVYRKCPKCKKSASIA